jgi:hypothetical protein
VVPARRKSGVKISSRTYGAQLRGFDSMLDADWSDAHVRSAIADWAPRFVSNGVALTDFEEVTAQVQNWDQWYQAWSARAAVHESAGRQALAREKYLSAGEHLQRAGVYYHFAKFLFVNDLTQMRSAYRKVVECRNTLHAPPSSYASRPASRLQAGLPEITRATARRDADAQGRRPQHQLSHFHHYRQARSHHTLAACGMACARGRSAGRADDYRGRQSRRQQPRLSLACASCGLDGGAIGVNASRKVMGRAICALRSTCSSCPRSSRTLHTSAGGRRPNGIVGGTVGARRPRRLDCRGVMTRGRYKRQNARCLILLGRGPVQKLGRTKCAALKCASAVLR